MDRISELADELLIKILSFLPTTKVAVSTSILSKRWECLWMWLPKLSFSSKRLRRFLSRNLPLHRAPVIESLHLDLYSECFKPEEIKLWLVVALSRNLRKLKIRYDRSSNKPDILPSSLYTCKSLVILELRGEICFDVPRMVCLPSLKTLQLVIYKYRLLSICPVLEDLEMHFDSENINAGMIIAIVPSLQSLSLYIPSDCEGVFDGLVIDTPSLKYLKLEDLNEGGHSYLIKNMPNLEDAYVDVRYPDISSLIKSITSAKRLALCSETVYGDCFVFNQLEHLKLCVCSDSSNLLFRLLEDSPNLRVLDIFEIVGSFFHKQLFFNKCSQYGFSLIFLFHYDVLWEDPPKTVHESILSSLQTFNWSRYLGKRPQEKDLAVYILGKKRFSLKDVTYEEQHPPILYQYRRVKA